MQKLAHQGDQLAYQQQFNAYQQQFNAWAHAKFGAVEWDLSEIHNKFNMREAVEESVGHWSRTTKSRAVGWVGLGLQSTTIASNVGNDEVREEVKSEINLI
jgi:hypothetical protein